MVIADSALCRTPALMRAMSLARKTEASLKLCLFEFHKELALGTSKHNAKNQNLDAYLRWRRAQLDEFAAALRNESFEAEETS